MLNNILYACYYKSAIGGLYIILSNILDKKVNPILSNTISYIFTLILNFMLDTFIFKPNITSKTGYFLNYIYVEFILYLLIYWITGYFLKKKKYYNKYLKLGKYYNTIIRCIVLSFTFLLFTYPLKNYIFEYNYI